LLKSLTSLIAIRKMDLIAKSVKLQDVTGASKLYGSCIPPEIVGNQYGLDLIRLRGLQTIRDGVLTRISQNVIMMHRNENYLDYHTNDIEHIFAKGYKNYIDEDGSGFDGDDEESEGTNSGDAKF
jgi:hypothetical protein